MPTTCVVLRAKDHGSLVDPPKNTSVLFNGKVRGVLWSNSCASAINTSLRNWPARVCIQCPVRPHLQSHILMNMTRFRFGNTKKKGDEGDLRFKEERLRFSETDKLKVFELQKYRYALVMPEADWTLNDIYRHERPNTNEIQGMMDQLARALQILHENRK